MAAAELAEWQAYAMLEDEETKRGQLQAEAKAGAADRRKGAAKP